MKKRLSAVLAGVLACSMMLSACGGSNAGNSTTAAATTAAGADTTAAPAAPAADTTAAAEAPATNEPKVLTIGVSDDIITLDSQDQNQTNTQDLFAMISSHLFKRDLDFNIVNDLCTEYEQLDDLTWQFKIRDDAKFSNGDPVTAADFKYSLDRVSTDTSLVGYTYYKCITGVEVIDDYTFKVTTDAPRPDLLTLLTMANSEPLPSKFLEENGWDAYLKAPVTSGQYLLKEWVPDDHYTIVRNPDYYGEPAYWDEVVYRAIPEASTRVSELLTGGVDLINNVPVNEWDRVSNNTDNGGTTLTYGDTSRVMLLILRMTDGWACSDPKVREAIECAIDKKAICDQLLQGAGTPTRSRVGSSVPGFNTDLFGDQANLYDPEKAKQLLTEAGYAPGQLTLNMDCPNGRYLMDVEMAQMIMAYLQAVGINVNLQPVDGSVLSQIFTGKENKDLLLIGLSDGQYDGCYPLAHYGDKERVAGQTDYDSAECQQLYKEALSEMDEAVKQEKERKIQAIAAEDRPHICIAQYKAIYGVNNKYTLSPRMDSNIMADEVRLAQ